MSLGHLNKQLTTRTLIYDLYLSLLTQGIAKLIGKVLSEIPGLLTNFYNLQLKSKFAENDKNAELQST